MKLKIQKLSLPLMIALLGIKTIASAQTLYQQTFNGEPAGTGQGSLSDVGWSSSGNAAFSGIYNNRTGNPTDAATSLPIPGVNAVGYAGSGSTGYLAVYTTGGSGTVGQSSFSAINLAVYPSLVFSVYLQQEQSGTAGPEYFLVQNGGNWYASAVGLTPPTSVDPTDGSFGSFNLESLNLTGAAANWVNVSGVGTGSLTLGSAAGANLTGNIAGVGLIENISGTSYGSWNYTDFQVSNVPEPTTLSLLGGAGFALMLTRLSYMRRKA
jgi:hypothetical protein